MRVSYINKVYLVLFEVVEMEELDIKFIADLLGRQLRNLPINKRR